jgi:hypothetical protein
MDFTMDMVIFYCIAKKRGRGWLDYQNWVTIPLGYVEYFGFVFSVSKE